MVKCSFIVGFAAFAVASSFVGVKAVGSGSAGNDTATTVTLPSVNATSVGVVVDVANATTPAATDAPTVKPTPTPTPKATEAIVTNSTAAPTPTVKAGPQPIAGQVTLVPGYNDCGGVGFNYTVYMPEDPATGGLTRLACEAGYRCQDIDGSDIFTCAVWPSREPVPFYGQCGGGNYDGQRFCAPGAVCKYISPSFSQCLPTY